MTGIDGTTAACRHVLLFRSISTIIRATAIRHRSTSRLCAIATIIINRASQRIVACWATRRFLNMTWIGTRRKTGYTRLQAMRGAGTSSNLMRAIKRVRGNLVTQSQTSGHPPNNRIAVHPRRPTEGRRPVSPDRHRGRRDRRRAAQMYLSCGAKSRPHLGRRTPVRSAHRRNNSDLRNSIRPPGRRHHSNQVQDRHSSQLLDRSRHSNQVQDRHSSRWLDRSLRNSRTNHGRMRRPDRELHRGAELDAIRSGLNQSWEIAGGRSGLTSIC
jgi:hypothetical protein